ncbi:PAS domain S-box protein [Leptolyngbya sp. BL0902]|uniref:PAS domain S-box protein n=1 Tax=Leptolyngbya sp. BL0902 TaxID=1115757 RepID=UPI0018E8108B|nr:PAS domain S-box protein [Leptolyngbya sp. BL0902]
MNVSTMPMLSPAAILELVAAITLQRQEGKAVAEIMADLVEHVRDLLRADRVLIYQMSAPTVAPATWTVAWEACLPTLPSLRGHPVQDPLVKADWWPRYQQRQSVAVANEREASLSLDDLAQWRCLQVRAVLATPMVVRQALWGLWVVQSQRPRTWQPVDIQLLEHLALHSSSFVDQPEFSAGHPAQPHPTARASSIDANPDSAEVARQADSRWKAAIEGSGAGLWDWNMQTNRVFYSRQWKASLGYDEADIGEDLSEWDSRVHPEDKAAAYAALEAHIQGQTPTYQSEHRLRCKDGSYRWMLDRGQVIEHTPDRKPLRMIGINNDITSHKDIEVALRQSEESLRESRNKYQTLFETLPLGIAITDAQGHILEVNPASEQLLGLTANEQTARTYDAPDWQIIRPDGSPMPASEFASVRALQDNCFVHNVEMGIVKATGDITWISVSAAPIPLEQYGVAICYVDITARKQLEQSLALANFSLEQLGVAALWVDREGLIRQANHHLCTSLGYGRNEVIMQPIHHVVPDLTDHWPVFWDAVRSQQHLITQAHHRTKDGVEFPVEVIVRHIQFMGEEYIFALAQDIRDRLRTETQLRLQSTALEACADAVVITDLQGRVEWANPAFTTITQYSLEEAKGKNPRELVKSGRHPERFYQNLWQTILSGQCWRGEIINRRKDGTLYYEFSTITPVFDDQGHIHHFIAIKQDISERKAIELTLRQQSERERMIQVITHRIRQSLNLSQILETTVAEVREFLDVDRVLIYRFHSDQTRVVIAESVASPWPPALGFEMPNTYFAELEHCLPVQGDIEVINDVNQAVLEPCHREILVQLQAQAKLMVPLWQGEMLWGMIVAHQCRSPRVWQSLDRGCFIQLAVQLEIAIQQAELYRQLEQANQELEHLATQDGLTQIANRRTFNRIVEIEWERMQRDQQFLSLLLIDVDHFKRYNDHYGHQAGDQCLCQVAQVLQQSAKRPADLVARYGGEEFAVLLPQTDATGAIQVAQEIQSTLRALAIEHRYSPVVPYITVSIGLSSVVPSSNLSIDQWVYQADQALYAAKAQGRNGYFQTP